MDDLALNNFVAGFVSGEGCFYITVSTQPTGRRQAQCAFSLKVRDDDRELIELVWRALKYSGGIHDIRAERYRYAWDSIKRHDAVMLLIRDLSELTSYVIPFFDRYPLRGQKRRNYELWKEAVAVMARGEQATPEGMEKVLAIKAQMNQYQAEGVEAEDLLRQ